MLALYIPFWLFIGVCVFDAENGSKHCTEVPGLCSVRFMKLTRHASNGCQTVYFEN